MSLPDRAELLARVRQKRQERERNKRDADEWRCPKADKEQKFEFYFIILPDLASGEKCRSIEATAPSDSGMWYHENGGHFYENKRYECPRIHDQGECEMCTLGFDLMRESEDKEYRSKIAFKYLAKSYFAVNIYFPNISKNPENLRGKVFWYNMPNSVWSKFDSCINSDDQGDTDDPKASGIFYHPTEGCYQFKLVAYKKGEYNTYEESCFLPRTFGPLARNADGTPNEARIQEILDQRLWLPGKFEARDNEKIKEIVAKLQAKEVGNEEEVVEEEPPQGAAAAKKQVAAPRPAPKPAAKPIAKPVAAKPAQKPVVAAKPIVEEQQAFAEQQVEAEPEQEAPAEQEPVAEPVAEEVPVEEVDQEAVLPTAEATEEPVEETPTEEVEQEAPPPVAAKPVAAPKPATTVAKPVAAPVKPVAKPVAAPVKPATTVAAKPVAAPARPATTVAAKPVAAPVKPVVTAAAVAEDDDELKNLLGAIRKKPPTK